MALPMFEQAVQSVDLMPAVCPLCPQATAREIYLGRDGIGYYQCLDCALWFASPRLSEAALLKMYEQPEYLSRSFRTDWTFQQWKASDTRAYLHARLKVRWFGRFLPAGSRLLDVGCGPGLTVAEALDQGFECEGIDPSGMLVDIGKSRFRIPVHHATVEQFQPQRPYDGVIVWDVLEHVPDPPQLLRQCRRFLVEDGLLFLQVPHYRGLSNRAKTALARAGLRSHFHHFGFPWHIYSFDRRSLGCVLERGGFEPLRMESWSSFLKNGRQKHVYRVVNRLFRERCWGDYLVCAARLASPPEA